MGFHHKLITAVLLLSTFAFASACERVALMPRPDIDREGRPIERDRSDVPGQANRHDVVGTIERVDRANNEIELRTTEARVLVIKYDPGTLVYDRDQEVGIDALRPRDQVLVETTRNARGDQYADTIRLNDSRTLGSRTY